MKYLPGRTGPTLDESLNLLGMDLEAALGLDRVQKRSWHLRLAQWRENTNNERASKLAGERGAAWKARW